MMMRRRGVGDHGPPLVGADRVVVLHPQIVEPSARASTSPMPPSTVRGRAGDLLGHGRVRDSWSNRLPACRHGVVYGQPQVMGQPFVFVVHETTSSVTTWPTTVPRDSGSPVS